MLKVAEIELIYRSKVKASDRVKVCCSSDAYNVFKQYWNKDNLELLEEFKILLLNRANKCLGIYDMSRGGVAGTVVDPKLLFTSALRAAASGIIMCHNHPSGSLTASRQDIQLTKKMKAAGLLLDINLLDHIIITSEGYYSLADNFDF
ncbi:JAB domain-containing protein [Reichenbachiella carrageenanivorans]|uniref:JAB domain-containing protein n=1 Tax=Reichenbachiella carrageenanivorans TaxID=2979869 RepID=A0ABY6D413_9BACT|nr:JAB domain-containing protein [Reichenbachiella carrageenanivorans]UXX80897.1 JAB domain-containing protein [Reichenbachiella carrageenanivorans]